MVLETLSFSFGLAESIVCFVFDAYFGELLIKDLLLGASFFIESCLIVGSDLVSFSRELLALLYLEKKTESLESDLFV